MYYTIICIAVAISNTFTALAIRNINETNNLQNEAISQCIR